MLRSLKNQSHSPGARASPTILARLARRGGNAAHPASLRGAREPSSRRATAAGGGARRTAPPPSACALSPWEARAQLILAMETGAVLEASGQLLVGPHPSSGRSSQPISAGEMWSQDALASPLPCGDSRYVRPRHTWDTCCLSFHPWVPLGSFSF